MPRLLPLAVAVLGFLCLARAEDASPLAADASAFVRGQAGSAIQWQPWGEAVFARAKAEGRPVYVFIGSGLSELSRATTKQSFALPEVIELLNGNFICVIADRDEHPALAAATQHYLGTVKQLSGWPAHLWLTPEGQPFEGGSYLPPSEEWGKASFLKIARQAKEAWTADPAACRNHATEAVGALANPFSAPAALSGNLADKLTASAAAWRETYDAVNGGFGEAPRNPEPELLRFMLRQSPADRDAALATLRAVANGAVHDPVEGGFFERATDAAWKIPYFQKSLAMQARLALAFLDAAQSDQDPIFAMAARSALDYTLASLALKDGGFAAAQDGTYDEQAGWFGWTEAEIDNALGADAAAFKAAYGVVPAGNVPAEEDAAGAFTGKNLLRRVTPRGEAAAESALAKSAEKLRVIRSAKGILPREERATAGAHGLLLAALSRAGSQLDEARYAAAAAKLFSDVQKSFVTAGGLRRMAKSEADASPTDRAALALGCREFGQRQKNTAAGELAVTLLAQARDDFLDQTGGRFYAAPAALPAGVFCRAPALSEGLSAESLALLAGLENNGAMVAALVATLETNPAAPGDVLLALFSTKP